MHLLRMLLLFFAFSANSAMAQDSNNFTPIPGQYIVLIKETVLTPVCLQQTEVADREQTAVNNAPLRTNNLVKLKSLRSSLGIAETAVLAEYADVVVGFTAQLTNQEVLRLQQHPDVEGVYQDYEVMSTFPDLEELPKGTEVTGQVTTCAITNAGGYLDGSTKSNYIWILDTGIDLDHPDLNVVTNPSLAKSFIPGVGPDDDHGHGTHVAGIAAAKNNGIGVVGVSAGAKVVPVKVLGSSGGGTWSQLLQGLNHVATYDKTNDVVNLSMGGYPITNCENSDVTLRNAIRNLGTSGTYVCIAAGNESGDAAKSRPGCINGVRVFTVGAMSCAKACATYSNWSSSVVDWVATGSSVYSTYKNGGYATMSGTSQATPVVSGIIHARVNAPLAGGLLNCGTPAAPYRIAKRN
jgi:subtilisin family serine protease